MKICKDLNAPKKLTKDQACSNLLRRHHAVTTRRIT